MAIYFLKKCGSAVFVDDEDLIHCVSLQLNKDGLIYKRWRERGKMISRALSRVIMNAPKHLQVDHINKNRFDNRKQNLRLATPSQNSCNRSRPKKDLLHKYRGIAFFKRNLKKPWAARIKFEKKQITLGYFETDVEAALAYDVAAKKYHGEFANLNFP
jgi:hypothetical protein